MSEPAAVQEERTFAVLGLFESPTQLMAAIPTVKENCPGRLEAYTPYPIHGIEKALGLRRSPLAGMVLVMGILGAIVAMVLAGWTSAVDYPIITGGKVPFSWEAFVPVLFEVMVLFATFTAGLGMLLLLNRLPYFRHPVLHSRAMPSLTRDKFALAIESRGGEAIDAAAAEETLLAAGAGSVEILPFPAARGPVSSEFLLRSAAAIVICCLLAGLATYWAVKLFPVLPPIVHMQDQPGLRPYRESNFFPDGAGMRLPVPGTVARGHLPYTIEDPEKAALLQNPLPRTKDVLERGREVYDIQCGVCHGVLGDGAGSLTSAYGAKPANLQSETFRKYPDGKIYHAIVAGKNSMPSYAADIPEDDRWAVVHYVRVLQRAQNATDADVEEALKE